ncbi:MAG: GHKL domain-containing protein [candidate division Zixibacteria bacterium]|nr:GHKL domain-containing protein [candidate division Zixibacteria bacterium]
MEKNRITCQSEFEPDLPELFVNKNQIMEMFLNLIINAIDAIGSEGGTIRLRALKQDHDNRPMIRIEIADTGCGISEKDKGSIFDRYYTTKETGTGLGLSVVERIISAHSGKIEVQSRVGEGTTFILHLPY